jgi:hypothetical protein
MCFPACGQVSGQHLRNRIFIPIGGFVFSSANLGVKMVMVTEDKVVPATEVEHASQMLPTLTETAIMTLGEIAALSEKVEGEVQLLVAKRLNITVAPWLVDLRLLAT